MKKIILLAAMAVSIAVAAQTKPCKGTTTKGQPCKSTFVLKDGYCRMHSPSTPRCGAKTSKGDACRMVVEAKGQKCKFHNH